MPALAAFVASRLLLEVAMAWSLSHRPLYSSVGHWQAYPDNPWLDGWVRWDSAWYISIFVEGYRFEPGVPCNATFFPLYPFVAGLLSRPLALMLGQPTAFHVAALLVSNVAFLLGGVGMLRLGRSLVGEEAARRAIWLLCFYPFSFFFSALYTEGLFFCLVVWAFVFGRESRWGAAFFVAGLSLLCRPHGVVVAAALSMQYARSTGLPRRRLHLRDGVVGWIACGLGALLLFYAYRLGHPLAFIEAQASWVGGHPGLLAEIGHIPADSLFDAVRKGVSLIVLLACMATSLPIARRYGPGYGLLTFLSVMLTGWSSLDSLGRYGGVAFPAFLFGGERLHGWRFGVVLLSSAILMVTFGIGFARWMHMF